MPATPDIVRNQQKIFLHLLERLQPRFRTDRQLPARIQQALARRSFGSRDRRLYRELLYTALRYLPWIEPLLDDDPAAAVPLIAWLSADSPATRAFRETAAAGWPVLPATLRARADAARGKLGRACDPAALLPAWFRAHCPALFEAPQPEALLARAPLWLRLQTSRGPEALDEFAGRKWHYLTSPLLPGAVRLLEEADVTATDAFRRGLVEVQDLGSQFILATLGDALAPGGRWLDACAGAGGKTLQLAGLLGPSGRVEAHDIRPEALRELKARAKRAGLANIAVFSKPPAALYDGVLVDAPCSGSGTWRRAPHLKWQTTDQQIQDHARRQQQLLGQFSRNVRPGGLLVYATCSLSRRENQDTAAAFLAAHPDFAPERPRRDFGGSPDFAGLTLFPATHATDGFYVATLRRGGGGA